MSQEQSFDLTGWWDAQSFPGKELYKIDEGGRLILSAHNTIKERVIAEITPENAGVVVQNLIEKFGEIEARVKEVEIEWIAAEDKLKVSEKIAHIKDYVQNTPAIGDFLRIGLLIHDWEHTIYSLTEGNYNEKLKLTELAESLVENTKWKETTQAFKDISDKWKLVGPIDRLRNDKLWQRIETARKAFLEKKRIHHEEEEKDLLANLDLKIDLVEQAEAIANATEWKKTTETFLRLTEEWKTIGHTVNKKNEELWHRFLAAKNTFFDNKREHSNQVQREQEQNYIIKEGLVGKAEALKESTSWNVTAQAMTALMEEWKKTGRVPKEKGDDLWNRFSAAQEHFFQAKRAHTDEIKTAQENNYQLKAAILQRAEDLKHSTHWGETTTEMLQLLEDWKKIGPIHRSHGDKMWEDFNAARKFFFARKDANRDQRKQYAEEQKVAKAEHAKGLVIKLRDDIREEEERLADFKMAIENISPGKKAKELREHLEQLIVACEQKIKTLKNKYSESQSLIKSVKEDKQEEA